MSCGDCGLVGEGELELDWRELAQCPLAAAPVVGVLGREHDRLVELVVVRQRRRFRTFFCSRACQDSIAALSPAEATRPIEPLSPAAVRTARKDLA